MGNVYMEADQVRFKNSTYRNLQTAVSAALEGGGGGGTTVIANPEGSATADLAKLQVGTTIYGIPAEAGDISYDNTSSGMTADDVQEAIDELNTGIGGITELIPSDATSSNKLATADDIPGVATASAPGIVQPDGTTITITGGVISAVGGSGSGEVYSDTETLIGTWYGQPLYRKCIDVGALPNNTAKSVPVASLSGITVRIIRGHGLLASGASNKVSVPIPLTAQTASGSCSLAYNNTTNTIEMVSSTDRSNVHGIVILDYTKDSENP